MSPALSGSSSSRTRSAAASTSSTASQRCGPTTSTGGTPYDVAAFTLIQNVIADCLGWGVGKYTHHAGSFHIYDETPPVVVAPEEEEFVPNVLTPVAHEGIDFEEFDFEANVLLKDLLQHLRAERPASEFVSSVESGANGEYWAQWGALVRFKWEAPAPA
jgi:hypothetical protein